MADMQPNCDNDQLNNRSLKIYLININNTKCDATIYSNASVWL